MEQNTSNSKPSKTESFKRWIYSIVLRIYLKNGKVKNYFTARSPLDIPFGSIFKLTLYTLIFSIVFGWFFLYSLRQFALHTLNQIKIELPLQTEKNADITKQITFLLFPKRTLPKEIIDTTIFKDGISVSGITKYINSYYKKDNYIKTIGHTEAVSDEQLSEFITGDIGLIQLALPTPYEISDKLKLPVNVEKPKDINERIVVMAAIEKLREELRKVSFSYSLLVMFCGWIQWLTFFFAVFCFVILMVKLGWANMQLMLIIPPSESGDKKSYIEWEKEKYENNIFDLSGEAKYTEKLRNECGNLFIAQRFADEIQHELYDDIPSEPAMFQIIDNKISNLRKEIEEGEYHLVNYALWVIPSLGFLGTIIGIIMAMENASGIFKAATELDQVIALENVSSNLGTAFNTTFVSLFVSVFLMLLNNLVLKVEDKIFLRLQSIGKNNLIIQLREKNTYLKNRFKRKDPDNEQS